jgi:hypothetical protein
LTKRFLASGLGRSEIVISRNEKRLQQEYVENETGMKILVMIHVSARVSSPSIII